MRSRLGGGRVRGGWRSRRRDHTEPQSRYATRYPGSQSAGRGVCPVGGVESAVAASSTAPVRRAAPHQRARGPCNHVVDTEDSEAGRPEQSDRGVVGFASVRRSVLEGQVFLEEAERRHSTRGGPAAPERVHAGCRLDSDLGQPRGCAFSNCELGGVACQGACCALA